MPGRRSFLVRAASTAPPEIVFSLLADATSWPRWSLVWRACLEREGLPAPFGVGAIRRFGGGPVVSREQVVLYEPARRFGYVMLSGLPVRGYRAQVDLVPAGRGTSIRWRGCFTVALPGTGPLLHWFLRRTVQGLARGLARHAGELHRRVAPPHT